MSTKFLWTEASEKAALIWHTSNLREILSHSRNCTELSFERSNMKLFCANFSFNGKMSSHTVKQQQTKLTEWVEKINVVWQLGSFRAAHATVVQNWRTHQLSLCIVWARRITWWCLRFALLIGLVEISLFANVLADLSHNQVTSNNQAYCRSAPNTLWFGC